MVKATQIIDKLTLKSSIIAMMSRLRLGDRSQNSTSTKWAFYKKYSPQNWSILQLYLSNYTIVSCPHVQSQVLHHTVKLTLFILCCLEYIWYDLDKKCISVLPYHPALTIVTIWYWPFTNSIHKWIPATSFMYDFFELGFPSSNVKQTSTNWHWWNGTMSFFVYTIHTKIKN